MRSGAEGVGRAVGMTATATTVSGSSCGIANRYLVLAVAADRVLELAQAAAHRAAHLGQALRSEDEEHDEAEQENLGQSDESRH